MRVRSVELRRFKRFHHFKIELPESPKLVILAGPNGCGKSSLFEAFNVWHRTNSGRGLNWDLNYYPKVGELELRMAAWNEAIKVGFHDDMPPERRKLFYIRSAYRNDPQFENTGLSSQGSALEEFRFNRVIENDV